MKIYTEDKDGKQSLILFDSQVEMKLMVAITTAAISGKPLNKQSSAYKLAKKIDELLPAF